MENGTSILFGLPGVAVDLVERVAGEAGASAPCRKLACARCPWPLRGLDIRTQVSLKVTLAEPQFPANLVGTDAPPSPVVPEPTLRDVQVPGGLGQVEKQIGTPSRHGEIPDPSMDSGEVCLLPEVARPAPLRPGLSARSCQWLCR